MLEDGNPPALFRVVFRAGTAAARTSSRPASADGVAEWTQPIDMAVYDTTAKLVAVVQQFNLVGGWIIKPDRHFFGSSVASQSNEWIHAPDLPTAPTFHAELRVDLEEDEIVVGDQSDEDFSGIPMLVSPVSLHSSGLDDSNGGNLEMKSISPTSVTTPCSTLITSSVGGGFFGEGARVGGVSTEDSPSSPVPSAPHPPPASPTAPPFYYDVLRERGPLGTAAGAAGTLIPFHPDLAMSRSFSWSPLVPKTAQPGGSAATSPGGKVPPLHPRPSPLFSWSPLVSPLALPKRTAAASPSFRSKLRRFFSGSPPVSPVTVPGDHRPAAKREEGQDTAATDESVPEKIKKKTKKQVRELNSHVVECP